MEMLSRTPDFLRMENKTQEQQAEVIDLYEELAKRFGEGYAMHIIKRYTGS